jgi:glycosyltransferase involved in cell wall biosynthesis
LTETPGAPARRISVLPVFLLPHGAARVFSLRDALTHRQGLGSQRQEPRVILSVIIIAYNEEANIARALTSVQPLVADGKGEIIVVDSGSNDNTVEITKSYGAKVFIEEWKGYAAQKNSAIEKATGDWILSLDADEEMGDGARGFVLDLLSGRLGTTFSEFDAVEFNRRNYFLGRWIRFGGFYPDPKIRLFRSGAGSFEVRLVHEDVQLGHEKRTFNPSEIYKERADFDLIHHSYPTLVDYIEHMNRYSSLGAEMAVAQGQRGFSLFNIIVRPFATFTYNYFFRLGFLDGCEGLLLHLYHAVYVSWKYAKAWELTRKKESR